MLIQQREEYEQELAWVLIQALFSSSLMVSDWLATLLTLIVSQVTATATTTSLGLSVALDPTLTAAFVSAIVAILILAIDRFWIEPRKWRRRYEIRWRQKQIEVHQWLLSVLAACRYKAGRIPHQQGEPERTYTHILESDDVQKLEDIFEKRAALLSDELKQTWYDLQKKDTTFLLDQTKHREPMTTGVDWFPALKHKVFAANLGAMERRVLDDLDAIRRELFGGKWKHGDPWIRRKELWES